MTRRKLYNFYIDPDLAAGLKKLKERERDSEGAIVRRALRRFLESEGVIKAPSRLARTKRKG